MHNFAVFVVVRALEKAALSTQISDSDDDLQGPINGPGKRLNTITGLMTELWHRWPPGASGGLRVVKGSGGRTKKNNMQSAILMTHADSQVCPHVCWTSSRRFDSDVTNPPLVHSEEHPTNFNYVFALHEKNESLVFNIATWSVVMMSC